MVLPSVIRHHSVLFPNFAKDVLDCINAANKDGHSIAIFESFRSPVRQQRLFDQGRATNGPIVTNSKPWQSWHQYGLAVDIAKFENGKWSWDFDPAKIAKYFEHPNIAWAGEKDPPHYQYKHLPKISLAQAFVAQNGGVLAFWATLL